MFALAGQRSGPRKGRTAVLDILGIDPEAEKTYESLMALGTATLSEVAALTGLPTTRTVAAVEALQDLGIVRQTGGSPPLYTAIDPGIALEVLLLHREEQVKQARARTMELSERFHRATAAHEPTRLVEIITGRQAVVERIDQIARSAHHEVRCFDTPPYAEDAIAANHSEHELVSRGGTVRVIYDRSAVEQPGRLAHLEAGVAWGEMARCLPQLPMKLLLIDDRIGAVPLQSSPSAIESTILVHPSGLLEGLSALFEALWQIALPLDIASTTRRRTPPAHPSHDERRILSLLTAGLSDEAAARQLNMSDRTYQRRIRGLMETLNVQTRFQLARQAIRRGWLADERADSQGERRASHPPTGVAALTAVTDRRPDSTTPHIASIRP